MLCGINTKTGRCMQVKDKKDISKLCEANHQTKRCKKKTAKKKIKGKDKDEDEDEELIDVNYRCPPGKIYNPKTKRCIKKDGPLGKQLMMKSGETIIGGPITFHYYKIKNGPIERKIILFGDEHTQYTHHESPDTVEITPLLKNIIRKSPHCIDFFSENAPYHADMKAKGKALQRHNNPLNAIRLEFGGCPVHNFPGQKCDYDNLRYHNWDLRMDASKMIELDKWLINPYDEILMNPIVFEKANSLFPIVSIIKFILGFPINKTVHKQINKFLDDEIDKKMKRESYAANISSKDILRDRQNLIQKEYAKCLKSTDFPKDFLKTFISAYKSLKDIDYTLVFTDFYMLCRMFMNFDISKNKKTPKKCHVKGKSNYKTPQFIIVYAGAQHNRNIMLFLEKMFGSKPVYTTGKVNHLSKQIHMKNIKTDKNTPNPQVIDDLFRDFY